MSLLHRSRTVLESGWFDPALAVIVCALSELEFLDGYPHRHGSKVGLAVLLAAMSFALAWRRRAPLAFVLWAASLELLIALNYASIADSQTAPWLLTVVPYTAAAMLPRSRAAVAIAAASASSVAVGFIWAEQPVQDATFVIAVILASAGFGHMIRSRRELDGVLRHRTERLTAEREDRVRLAVADERSRIARELHAVVANSVSTMVVQAQAAQRLLREGDPCAEASMDSIEVMGRVTLGEIRRMLGVLRDSAAGVPLAPQPGVGRLHELAASARSRGRRVTLSVEGEPGALASSVELAIYRIVEETLAGAAPETPSTIVLRYLERDIELELSGREAPGLQWPSVAMRERVDLCDGTIERRAADEGGGGRLQITLPRGFRGASSAHTPAPQTLFSGAASPGLMIPNS